MEDIKGVVSIWYDTFLWGIKIDPCFPGFPILRHLQNILIAKTKETLTDDSDL